MCYARKGGFTVLRMICGMTVKSQYNWLSSKVPDIYSYSVKPDWFEDRIVRDELKEVDKIYDVQGLCLLKENGVAISPNWLSQGTRQFLMMTQNKFLIYDSTFFGVNVYPFFCRWANEKNIDVTIITSYLGEWEYDDLNGICLNTGEYFHTGLEMQHMIIKNRDVMLDDMTPDGKILARNLVSNKNDVMVYTGEPYYIDTGIKLPKDLI